MSHAPLIRSIQLTGAAILVAACAGTERQVEGIFDARNRGDVAALLDAHADDGRCMTTGPCSRARSRRRRLPRHRRGANLKAVR